LGGKRARNSIRYGCKKCSKSRANQTARSMKA
jgi:hypothetical protein